MCTYLVLSCHLWTHSWPVVFRVLLGGPCQSIETQCHLWNVPCLKKVRGLTIFLEGKMRFRFNMQMNFITYSKICSLGFEFFDLQDFLVRDAIVFDGFEEWLNVFHQKKGRTWFLELGYGSRRYFVHQFTQYNTIFQNLLELWKIRNNHLQSSMNYLGINKIWKIAIFEKSRVLYIPLHILPLAEVLPSPLRSIPLPLFPVLVFFQAWWIGFKAITYNELRKCTLMTLWFR